MISLGDLLSLLKNEFEGAVMDSCFAHERHFQNELLRFLTLNLPIDSAVVPDVRTESGVVDILVDERFILELKYADNRGTLDTGIAEVVRYRELGKDIVMVLLDVGILESEVLNKYCNYYKDLGAATVILRAYGKRERSDFIMAELESLLAEKRLISVEELTEVSKIESSSLYVALSRLENRGRLERIEKGKYIVIPFGSKKGEYTLNEFVIGSVLVKPCAIAYWSALNYYRLTEQIPSTVFLQTTSRRKILTKEIFGVHYQVVRVRETKLFGIDKLTLDEEEVQITDREKTVVDCLDKPQYCGGIIEAAKALNTREYDTTKLAEYAIKLGNNAVIRRLGHLCDLLRVNVSLPKIDSRNYLYLDPTMPHKGERVAKWRLINNLDERTMGELE